MHLSSPAFASQAEIPIVHTCQGEDRRPPLAWTDPPNGTRSFALIVDDPDAPDPAAPKVVWVHWVAYDVPPSARELAAGAELPPGAREGLNDWKRPRWSGPCPPKGRHRYVFKLYALDTTLPDLKQPTKADLQRAMTGHILGETELVGTYQKRAGP
jgi:Raf kinase inhibitor-like YbhB/YbcL family protein